MIGMLYDMSLAPHVVAMMMFYVNLALCMWTGIICICRFAVMSENVTTTQVRAIYVSIFMAAFVSGWSRVLFNDWPGIGQIVGSAAMLMKVLLDYQDWKDGHPQYAMKGFVEQLKL